MKKIIELNNTLIIGISLIVLSFFSMLNFIVTTIVYETSRDFLFILCIALLNLAYLLIGVSFIWFEKIKLPLIPIALFLFAVISIYSIKDMFLAIPIYVILAVISLMNYKYAKVGLGIIAFLLCINIFDIFLGSVIDYVRLMDNPQNYVAHVFVK